MPWRKIGTVGLILIAMVPNVLLMREALGTLQMPMTFDWWLIEEAGRREGAMYVWEQGDPDYLYRYSPLLPYLTAPLTLDVWRLLHLAVLPLLPWRIAVAMLVFAPFWLDLAHGNFLTFALVFGWLALAGSRWAMAAYFALALLIPRPLMLPVFAWLLWKRPESRPIAAAVVAVNLALLIPTGELVSWVMALSQGGDVIASEFNWSPSRFLGAWWIPFGLVLGAWLTWKGRLGLAALAISPYVLPYYLVMGWLELRQRPAPA